jgi:hypothetical protein
MGVGTRLGVVRGIATRGRLVLVMAAMAAGAVGCPPTPGPSGYDENLQIFDPITGYVWFQSSPPYQFPVESTFTFNSGQLGVVPLLPLAPGYTQPTTLAARYSNNSPCVQGPNEVLFFARDPDEEYAAFASNLEQTQSEPSPDNWACNLVAPPPTNFSVSPAVTLPDAVGLVWPVAGGLAGSFSVGDVALDDKVFTGGNNAGQTINSPVLAGCGGSLPFPSVQSAYIVKHGTCAATTALKPILQQIDDSVEAGIAGAEGAFCSNIGLPSVNYVRSVAWMTEGGLQVRPPQGGFILEVHANDYGDVVLNTSYTFGLDTQGPWGGVLTVTPSENGYYDSGGAGGPSLLSGLRQSLEDTSVEPEQGSCGPTPTLRGQLELQAFSKQSQPLPNPQVGAKGYLPCSIDGAIPSANDVTNDPFLPFQTQYCGVSSFMSIAIGSGMDHLKIAPKYQPYIENALLSTFSCGDGKQCWSNFQCNFHPNYSRTPTCEVVARASRVVAMPDSVELVWFDRNDTGGLTDFSSESLFADGTLYNNEAFALFVALNNTITGPPNPSALCQDQPPVNTLPRYHPYAFDWFPMGLHGCPAGQPNCSVRGQEPR